nr:CD48 antigen-like [Misgurnus anguillicaudatus]
MSVGVNVLSAYLGSPYGDFSTRAHTVPCRVTHSSSLFLHRQQLGHRGTVNWTWFTLTSSLTTAHAHGSDWDTEAQWGKQFLCGVGGNPLYKLDGYRGVKRHAVSPGRALPSPRYRWAIEHWTGAPLCRGLGAAKFLHLFLCVFGDEVKSVSVMEGNSVTLHIDIKLQTGDLIEWKFGAQETLIARINVVFKDISIHVLDERFRDRLEVNDQTGDLTITNITTQHSGLYKIIINSAREISYRFNVTVYAHLPVPVISKDCTKNSVSSNCSLLCSVLNVRDVSLSWYKGNSLLSSISVSDLNIRLSLSLEVEYQDKNTYSCVVNNPISNQTQHLNITQLCQTCSSTSITLSLMCKILFIKYLLFSF